jgi:hypothetical protein
VHKRGFLAFDGAGALVYARNFANQSLVTMVCEENASVFCVFSSVADVTKRAAKSSVEVDPVG